LTSLFKAVLFDAVMVVVMGAIVVDVNVVVLLGDDVDADFSRSNYSSSFSSSAS
jgi:hypothetical protein